MLRGLYFISNSHFYKLGLWMNKLKENDRNYALLTMFSNNRGMSKVLSKALVWCLY